MSASGSVAHLVRVQELELAARAAAERLGRLPAEAAALEDRLAGAKARVEAAKKGQAEVARERRELEQEIKAMEAKISRWNDQLRDVKTNAEYSALSHEIAHERRLVAEVEERILMGMERADELGRELAAAGEELVRASEALAGERDALELERARLEGEREKLARQAADLQDALAVPLLTLYRRLASRGGVAVAAVVDETCQLCRVRVRPHIVDQLRGGDRVLQCESCQRILYLPPPAAAV